jgi:hypothetical protein
MTNRGMAWVAAALMGAILVLVVAADIAMFYVLWHAGAS